MYIYILPMLYSSKETSHNIFETPFLGRLAPIFLPASLHLHLHRWFEAFFSAAMSCCRICFPCCRKVDKAYHSARQKKRLKRNGKGFKISNRRCKTVRLQEKDRKGWFLFIYSAIPTFLSKYWCCLGVWWYGVQDQNCRKLHCNMVVLIMSMAHSYVRSPSQMPCHSLVQRHCSSSVASQSLWPEVQQEVRQRRLGRNLEV